MMRRRLLIVVIAAVALMSAAGGAAVAFTGSGASSSSSPRTHATSSSSGFTLTNVTPAVGSPDAIVFLQGTGCTDATYVIAELDTASGELIVQGTPASADASGAWSAAVEVPSDSAPGQYKVLAGCYGTPYTSVSQAFTVAGTPPTTTDETSSTLPPRARSVNVKPLR